MSDPKGPKVELPEDLVAELEQSAADTPEPSGPETTAAEASATSAKRAGADEDAASELDELKDKYLRLAADFDNHKRRNLKERQEVFNYGNENLIKELLPVVDNLERAIGHVGGAEEAGEAKPLLEGIELTYRSLMQALEKVGVVQVRPEGGAFDPKLHEAVRQVDTDEHPPGHIVEVMQTGYLLMDRLLRPALVVVAGGRAETPD